MFNCLLLVILNVSHADVRYSFDSYLSGQKSEIIDSTINPFNKVLGLSSEEIDLDLRPEIKWKTAKNQLVTRLRWLGKFQKITDLSDDKEKPNSKGELNLTDAFIESNWNRVLTTTVGLQVYQWGPAEFFNASNPFFHFRNQQKSLFYKEKGQVIVRSNLSLSKENNLVLAVVPVSNNESQWIEEDQFELKSFIKYELSWAGTSNNIGIVVGSEEKRNLFIGEYFNYSLFEGTAVYADIKHSQYKVNFEPVKNGPSYDMLEVKNLQDQWFTFGILGMRWETSFDLRFEYIFNTAGYDAEATKNAIQSASNQLSLNYLKNLKRFLKPGLELIGQNYLYVSLRVADPFNIKDFNFYLRDLYSVQDKSSQIQIESDKSFLDNYTLYASQTLTYGQDNTEFRLTNTWSFLIGLKYSL